MPEVIERLTHARIEKWFMVVMNATESVCSCDPPKGRTVTKPVAFIKDHAHASDPEVMRQCADTFTKLKEHGRYWPWGEEIIPVLVLVTERDGKEIYRILHHLPIVEGVEFVDFTKEMDEPYMMFNVIPLSTWKQVGKPGW